MMAENQEKIIAQDVLAYLLEHPQAQDTLEGIVEWWLQERHIKRYLPQVEASLEELCRRGLVLRQVGTDKRTHYNLNRSRTQEIQVYLRDAAP